MSFGEIEVIERTTRYRPASKQAFDAIQDHLSQAPPMAPAAPLAPEAQAIAAAPSPANPGPKVYSHVRLHGPSLRIDAGELAPMPKIWDVVSTDLCGGLWRSTPWIIEKVTDRLIVRPDRIVKGDGYYLVRRSVQSRMKDACKRLARQKLQMWVRPIRGGVDSEYRVLHNEYAVPEILDWRGD